MQRVQWRQPRRGHEREDIAHNEMLAERLLSDPTCDDFAIALDQIGFRIVGSNDERWVMLDRRVLTPSWAVSVDQAERDAKRGAAVVAEIDRHMPRPKAAVRF
jgi:hypothetical protein